MRRPVLTVFLLAAIAALALADREIAAFSAGRGDKALAAKKFDEAEGHYRKALEEDDTFLPARHGLAQALQGQGKTQQAIEEFRKVLNAARADAAVAAEWKDVVAKSEKQLLAIDVLGTALRKIHGAYADALVDFAQRWAGKDNAAAERALRRALTLRPDDARATQLLEKLAPPKGNVTQLFDGKSTDGWFFANAPMWTVEDGALVGTSGGSPYLTRTGQTFEGDFTVRCEAKLIAKTGEPAWVALLPSWRSPEDRYSFGLMDSDIVWDDKTGAQAQVRAVATRPASRVKSFDAAQWNTYEMRFDGDEVVALVNGVEIGREKRPENRRDGFVGVVVANVKAAFRKVEVEKREHAPK